MFPATQPIPQKKTFIRRPAHIDTVEIEVGDGLRLNVNGCHQDASHVPTRIEQRRKGQHIAVRLFREWDTDSVIPAGRALFDDSIILEGDFSAGTYTVDVNGHIIKVVV